MTFTDLGILPVLTEALTRDQIREPTTVQTASIPPILAGKDTYLSSETGTGKTLAYLLPLLTRLDPAARTLQAILLTPTHELAMQIQRQIESLVQHSGLAFRAQPLIGGASLKRQIERLRDKPHLVAGTADRILDLIESRKLKVHEVRTIVVDEADRMLSGEKLDSVRRIIRATLKSRQLLFVSATRQRESTREASALAPGLVTVDTGADRINRDIEHLYFVGEERKKVDLLRRLLNAFAPERAIVFVHRNEKAGALAGKLAYHRLPVAEIHADCDKQTRKKALADFRSGRAKILISSDISARGIDVRGVTHIFSFDIPSQSRDYLHRAGRTGRAGTQGYSILLMTDRETRLVKRYQRDLHIRVRPARVERGEILIDDAPSSAASPP